MKTILFFIITCFFVLSCHKDMIPPRPIPPPIVDTLIKPFLWRIQIGNQLNYKFSNFVHFDKVNNLIYTAKLDLGGGRDTVYGIDLNTRKVEWAWAERFTNTIALDLGSKFLSSHITAQGLIMTQNDILFQIDKNGYTLWKNRAPDNECGHHLVTYDGESVYQTFAYCTLPQDRQKEKIVKIRTADHYRDSLTMEDDNLETDKMALGAPVPGKLANGDDIIIYNRWQYVTKPPDSTYLPFVDLICYNVTKRQEHWRINSIVRGRESGEAVQTEGLYDGDYFYFPTNRHIHKININTGQLEWNRDIMNQGKLDALYAGSLSFCNDKLIVKTNIGIFHQINKASGVIEQSGTTVDGGASSNTIIYKNKLYYASWGTHELVVFNLDTFVMEHAYLSPQRTIFDRYSTANFGSSTLAIDRDKGLLYLGDGYYLYCMQLD
jgi:outer membrane protein assembly factor BamB